MLSARGDRFAFHTCRPIYVGEARHESLKTLEVLRGSVLFYVILYRGVQYVHWVMHKCIMVKVGGNEIHVKYVKSR